MEGSSQLFLAMMFGAFGLGYFSYGRKQKAIVPLFSGIGLFVIPYFLDNLYALIVAGMILLALPWFVKI